MNAQGRMRVFFQVLAEHGIDEAKARRWLPDWWNDEIAATAAGMSEAESHAAKLFDVPIAEFTGARRDAELREDVNRVVNLWTKGHEGMSLAELCQGNSDLMKAANDELRRRWKRDDPDAIVGQVVDEAPWQPRQRSSYDPSRDDPDLFVVEIAYRLTIPLEPIDATDAERIASIKRDGFSTVEAAAYDGRGSIQVRRVSEARFEEEG
jgi:hypothetical protein